MVIYNLMYLYSVFPYVFLQLWEISSGEMLMSVLFDVSIMSVTLDPCEFFLFCGGSDGNIFQVSLCNTVSVCVLFDLDLNCCVSFLGSVCMSM